MTLAEVIAALDYELQDTGTIWDDNERTRAIQKTVNLMSRLLPKRSIIETTIGGAVTGETLTIASSVGTLAYHPVKPGSLVITGETLDTDYTVNYLTGVVTEVGSLLGDGSYTVSYERDSRIIDISTVLPDYVRLERVEYPVGNDPPTNPTFDVIGDYIIVRGQKVSLTEASHLRIIYLGKWTPPVNQPEWTVDTVKYLHDYVVPTSGNVTGYIYECTARSGDFKTHAATEPAWTIVPGSTIADDAVVWTCRESDSDYPTHLDDAVVIGSAGQCLIYKAELYVQSAVSALSAITAVTAYTYVKPGSASIPAYTVMTALAPALETPVFTAAETALTAIQTNVAAAIAFLTTGTPFINAIPIGDNVGTTYAEYARVNMEAAGHKVNEAIARLRQIEAGISNYASKVAAYGSTVNAYANNISGLIGKQREDVNAEIAAVQDYASRVSYYSAQVANQEMKAKNFLDAAGRYLASGQSKINEMFAMLGVKPEFSQLRALSEQRD